MPFLANVALASWYLCDESRLGDEDLVSAASYKKGIRPGRTYRAFDGMQPTLRQVPPGGPRASMHIVL